MATSKYLDYNGLLYFWTKLKTIFLNGVSTNTDTAKCVNTWTANTPTEVTKKTVVTSVTPATVVTNASGATTSYSAGVFTITDGSFTTGSAASVTTGDSVTVVAGSPASLTTTDKTVVTSVSGTKAT